MEFDFGVVWRNFDALLGGLADTLWLTAACLVVALPVGLLGAAARMSDHGALRGLARGYIVVFCSTPPLVLLFWSFYALPLIAGIRMSSFAAGLLTLSLQSGAFFAEVVRGGVQSIERGQWEAGRAIGMSGPALMRRIIMPQAIRRMLPGLLDRSIELLKTTSLVSAIAYSELLFEAQALSSKTFRPLEVFTVAALMYFVVLFAISRLARVAEVAMLRRQ